MTFINWTTLFALAAVAIPIVIHLLNRRQARAIGWGAMRFLLASVASRNQRILLEELLLMILRCLAVALLVLAVARPYLPSRAGLGLLLVLPAVLVAAMLAGVGAVLHTRRRLRLGLWIAAGVLVAAGALGTLYEQSIQQKFWQAGGERDIAIIVDGSSSMTLSLGGTTNFQRALDEARAVIDSCRPGDAVSLVLAGPVPRALLASPTYDRKDLQAALAEMTPVGGAMNAADAISLALATLIDGHNPTKKIILITDAQNVGWDLSAPARWSALEAACKDLPQRPSLVVRTLALPTTFRNLAVTDLRLSRGVIGVDRAVRIEAALANTGTVAMDAGGVELLVDGLAVGRQTVGKIPPNGSEKVQFEYRFQNGGYHVLTARLAAGQSPATAPAAAEDDMPFDNQLTRVAYVLGRLPVLLVEGSPSPAPLEGSADFMDIAMAPNTAAVEASPAPPSPSAAPNAAPGDSATSAAAKDLIAPQIVSAADIGSIADFGPYRLVVLANVPKLNAAAAAALAKYVRQGGGLWLSPGDKADGAFYNSWCDLSGDHVCPAVMGPQRIVPPQGVHLAAKTFSHPALDLLAQTTGADISAALMRAYWPLTVNDKDPSVRVGGRLDDGAPLLVERRLGKGCVLMTPMSLDRRDCNIPTLQCFVPLVHEAVYYLAASTVPQLNLPPGAEVTLNLPLPEGKPLPPLKASQMLPVSTPSGHRKVATVLAAAETLQASFRGADQPGLYHLLLPSAQDKGPETPLPWVVLGQSEESRLTSLTAADFDLVGKRLPLLHAQSTAELTSAITGRVPGREIWRLLALAALVGLLAEITLTRWIAQQRKAHKVQIVQFGHASASQQPTANSQQATATRQRRREATANRHKV